MTYLKKFVIIILGTICSTTEIYSDIIYLKSGKLIRGKIIKETQDKVLINTLGEIKHIYRPNIKKINYDSQDKNLLERGNYYLKKDRYQEALDYYEKALKINPNSLEVKEAILKIQKILFKKKERQKQHLLKQRTKIQNRSKTSNANATEDFNNIHGEELFIEKTIGITCKYANQKFYIDTVEANSPAGKNHIFPQDKIYSINYKKVKEKSLEKLYKTIINTEKKHYELTIERKVVIIRGSKHFYQKAWHRINAKVDKQEDLFYITSITKDGRADLAGLKINDIIVSVDGVSSKMLSLDKFEKKLQGTKGSHLSLRIRRQLLVKKYKSEEGTFHHKVC